MRAALEAEPVAEAEEVFLVNRIQHRSGRSLDDLVFERRHCQWPLFAIRLRYVRPAGGLCPVCSPLNPRVQISEVSVKVCFVGPPRQSVHAGGGIAFEREERQLKRGDTDVVEERGEPLLLPLPCCLSYALQRL